MKSLTNLKLCISDPYLLRDDIEITEHLYNQHEILDFIASQVFDLDEIKSGFCFDGYDIKREVQYLNSISN